MRLVAALFALLLLPGCSYTAALFVFNNSGSQIAISAAPDAAISMISAGEGRAVATATGADWDLRVRGGDCVLTYRVPQSINAPDYLWNEEAQGTPEGGYIKVQIEPDFSLHVVPGDAQAPVDISQNRSTQPTGFPLMPERVCN